MKSKWIREVSEAIANDENYDRRPSISLQILERIDKLLKQAMHSTDDESLYDKIRKEITNED